MMGASIFFESSSSSPIRRAISVLLNTILAPSSAQRSATFQAMDMLFNAPKMIPRLPFNKLYAILYPLKIRHKNTDFMPNNQENGHKSAFSPREERQSNRRTFVCYATLSEN